MCSCVQWVWAHLSWCTGRGQRTTLWSWFSLSTLMCTLEIKPRWSARAVNTFYTLNHLAGPYFHCSYILLKVICMCVCAHARVCAHTHTHHGTSVYRSGDNLGVCPHFVLKQSLVCFCVSQANWPQVSEDFPVFVSYLLMGVLRWDMHTTECGFYVDSGDSNSDLNGKPSPKPPQWFCRCCWRFSSKPPPCPIFSLYWGCFWDFFFFSENRDLFWPTLLTSPHVLSTEPPFCSPRSGSCPWCWRSVAHQDPGVIRRRKHINTWCLLIRTFILPVPFVLYGHIYLITVDKNYALKKCTVHCVD